MFSYKNGKFIWEPNDIPKTEWRTVSSLKIKNYGVQVNRRNFDQSDDWPNHTLNIKKLIRCFDIKEAEIVD